MAGGLSSREEQAEAELEEALVPCEETYRLLLLSLWFSLLSSALGIFVTIKSRMETEAENRKAKAEKKKEQKKLKKELEELREEIALLKKSREIAGYTCQLIPPGHESQLLPP